MKVFTDTSGLFAAVVRNDVMHDPAKATLKVLLEAGTELHATSYVLQETLALLQSRVSLDAALRFEHELRPLLHMTWMDEERHRRAFRRLERAHKRRLSLVDCASFVVMEELDIESAFAYDTHFTQAGFGVIARPEDVSAQEAEP